MDTHTMTLSGNTPDGDEIWVCPLCGRELLITWEPIFDNMVLVDGDIYVTHSVGIEYGRNEYGGNEIWEAE